MKELGEAKNVLSMEIEIRKVAEFA